MFFPSGSPSSGRFGGALDERDCAWFIEGGAWGSGVGSGFLVEADRNMSCHAGVVVLGSEYGTISMVDDGDDDAAEHAHRESGDLNCFVQCVPILW